MEEKEPIWRWAIYVIYCMEMGIFLCLAPWTVLWETNYFYYLFPRLAPIALSGWARGAVCAFGCVLICLSGESIVIKIRTTWFGKKENV